MAKEVNSKMRYERKFFVEGLHFKHVEHVVKMHPFGFRTQYPDRHVNNIYYDTIDLKNFNDNVDGLSKRIKVRIRWYGKSFGLIKKPVLEIKIKNGSLGYKKTTNLKPIEMDSNISEKISSILNNNNVLPIIKESLSPMRPILMNRYHRKYYLSADKRFRITIDNAMEVFPLMGGEKAFFRNVSDSSCTIMELKYDREHDDNAPDITTIFPFRVTKSSKYISGLENIY